MLLGVFFQCVTAMCPKSLLATASYKNIFDDNKFNDVLLSFFTKLPVASIEILQ